MGFLSQLSAGAVHDAPDGRRVFCHGLLRKRCVFVDAGEERRLRRASETGFVGMFLTVVLPAAVAPLWLRALVILPAGMIILELVLRRMTRHMPAGPRPGTPSFADTNRKMAADAGQAPLWCQLVGFAAMAAFLVSGVVPDEALGWRKHAGLAIALAMIVQSGYQLMLLGRGSRSTGGQARPGTTLR